MKNLFRLIGLCLTMVQSSILYSQSDTLFWFAAPDASNTVGETPIELLLVGKNDNATVTIDMPANGSFTPIVVSLNANTSQIIDLSASLGQIESSAPDVVNNNGLRISATEPISANYMLNAPSNKELFVLKGSRGLGQNFYTPFQNVLVLSGSVTSAKSTIEIVATEDNTTVLVTPRTDVVGHLANNTFSVVLNQGETYTVADVDVNGSTSLSGSIVSSNKDISVTVSEDALEQGSCESTIGDQLVSLENTGTKFAIHKASGSTTDYIVVLATENGTDLTLTNTSTTNQLINWGETVVFSTTDDLNYIQSNKPVYVLHVSGNGCETSAAIVPSMVCSGDSTASFVRPSGGNMSLFLYTFAGFENQFTLNGSAGIINAASFQPIPGTSGQYVGALVPINISDVPANNHFTVSNSANFGMGIVGEQTGAGSYYGFPSSYKTQNRSIAGNDTIICANLSLDLDGFIGGGSVTGVWSTSGYGTFTNSNTDLANEYVPNALDTLVSPVRLILSSTGECPIAKDTLLVTVTPAPIMNAGVDQSLCVNNSTAALTGTAEGGTSSGVWSSEGDGTFNPSLTDLNALYEPGPNDIASGNVDIVLTSTGASSCLVVRDTMSLSFATSPEVTILPDTISVCENNAVVSLSGTVSGLTSTGKWTTPGNGIFTPNNLSLVVDYTPTPQEISAGGLYIYLTSTNNGICNQEVDSVYVEFTSQPTVNAGQDYILCANTPEITLNGSVTGASGGQWTGGSGTISDPNQLSTNYEPTTAEINAGSVIFTLESTGNGTCNSEFDQVEVNFIQPPQANFTASSVCLGEETEILDISLPVFGNITSWEWDFGNANTSTDQNNSVTFSAPGINSVQLIVTTDANCSDTISQNVEVYELPVADFSETLSCNNGQIIGSFTDESTSSDPINFWYYDFGGLGTIAVPNPAQVFPPNGNYSVLHIVRTSNGCSDSIQKTIEIPSLPEAGFSYNSGNSPTVGATYNFVDTSLNSTDIWWDINGSIISEQNPSQIYFSNGVYYVTQYVSNDIGCLDSVQKPIVVDIVTDEISQLIPNAISPNNDGFNDVWELEFIDLLYTDATVTIFNQWGQLIFESQGYETPWDGRFNGEHVADGNYYYVIQLNDAEKQVFKGVLLVLKTR